ncbi:class I SAM-dependent methyltransferase [Niveispirillum lacus]|uniref:class I SAM-dependent methyltransferase n=1 Tax=Niveispirillum lacus TaxID=1981099 RepID=UPI0013FDC851|nr:50S ribosomal protein L11 methyltransferase [Niveispirillum lacus]
MPPPSAAADPEAFIRAHTAPGPVPLRPDIILWQATEITPIWHATADWLEHHAVPPPFWAFPWAGGQAISRLIADEPSLVAGKRVVDFAAGSGLIAIAAAKAGAAQVTALDIDPFAGAATLLNAALNKVRVRTLVADMIGQKLPGTDIILAGDVCYEQAFAEAALAWFRDLARAGITVLVGDPGRAYLPSQGLCRLASYDVPTSLELEDRDVRHTDVWRVPMD